METYIMHGLQILVRRVRPLAAAFLGSLALTAMAQTTALEEGNQYLRLKAPQPVETGKKIEVIEFFSYGCPHCADLEPTLQGWIKTMPADVQMRRVPVMYQDRWVPLAKIYYTLDALGEESRLSPAVFSALHARGMSLWQDKTFFDWAATQGLDRKKVEDMYNSFAISGKVNRARAAAQAYQIQAVPTMVVDGKFITNKVSSHAMMIAVLDALIAKARAERPKG
jgi:protein dithiol oxidoreductase (disulfide-forming)